MSVRRHLLNRWMRLVEKPQMRYSRRPQNLRRALEIKARLCFRAPRETSRKWVTLAQGGDRIEALEISPRHSQSDCVILYIHGGAFVFGSPDTHAAMLAQLALRTGARVVLPRYRRAPEHVFPAAADDVRSAWDGLISSGTPADRIVIGGDSAGGTLAFGLLGGLIAEGADLPMALFGFSPLTDMTMSSESFRINRASDVLLPAVRAGDMCRMYLGDCPASDPRVCPMQANFPGAPPVWLTVSDSEILRDDSRAMQRKLTEAGVEATLEECHDLPHVWPLLHNFLPEARETLDHLALWLRQRPGWTIES